jgi:FkbM family methyltransferase
MPSDRGTIAGSRVKTYGKYLFLVVAGCAIGAAYVTGMDARGRFIPQRFLLRSVRVWEKVSGYHSTVFEKPGALKPVRVEVERGVSLLLDPGDLVAWEILITGVWQPQVWQSISDGLSSGAVLLDVGAHIGYDSLKGSVRVGESGKVISFEPNPGTLEQLRANIAASHATNVIVEPIACADRDQTLTLYDSTSEGNSGGSSLSLANADAAGRGTLPSYSVRGRPIDDVVRELALSRVDVIKVDVEGAEYLVLRGARETLRRFHPKLVMEVVPAQLASLNATVEDLVSLMKELGYGPAKEVDGTDWEWTVN